ncbi:MAG: hypothetical protein ABI644_02835 [Arenimonas sp.]
MDYCRQSKSLLIGSIIFAASSITLALSANIPLRASGWVPADRQLHALSFEPVECLLPGRDEKITRSVAIGRAAFRTPLVLGGQAARAGLSCNSCHRNGHNNPDFMFPGLSGLAGTADVTSSLMSSHRGDGVVNPAIIPDLGGPKNSRKISRDTSNRELETFIHGLIVEEFDGPEPTQLTIDGLASYVRMLSVNACPTAAEQKIRLSGYLYDARNAMQAAQFSIDAKDPGTTRLMLASARSVLGMINERYAGPELASDRRLLSDADLELAAIQQALDNGADDVPLRIIAWQTRMPRWTKKLEHNESLSLFNATHLTSKP